MSIYRVRWNKTMLRVRGNSRFTISQQFPKKKMSKWNLTRTWFVLWGKGVRDGSFCSRINSKLEQNIMCLDTRSGINWLCGFIQNIGSLWVSISICLTERLRMFYHQYFLPIKPNSSVFQGAIIFHSEHLRIQEPVHLIDNKVKVYKFSRTKLN